MEMKKTETEEEGKKKVWVALYAHYSKVPGATMRFWGDNRQEVNSPTKTKKKKKKFPEQLYK